MPEVIVLADSRQATNRPGKAYLESDDGTRVYLSWAPKETTVEGMAPDFQPIPRPGRKPVLGRGTDGLMTCNFTALMGNLAGLAITADIEAIKRMATSGQRVRFSYGTMEAGWWRITSLSIASQEREPVTNQVTRANVTATLTEDSQLSLKPGVSVVSAGGSKGWRTYTWRKGDTLFKVAKRFLGKGSRWKEIARANKIKKPKAIRVGTRLRIPPK